jgi:hypothetical protein
MLAVTATGRLSTSVHVTVVTELIRAVMGSSVWVPVVSGQSRAETKTSASC